MVLRLNTVAKVPTKAKTKLLEGLYFFSPDLLRTTQHVQQQAGIYSQLVDHDFDYVLMRNPTDQDLVIPRHTFLGHVEPFTDEECALLDADQHPTAVYGLYEWPHDMKAARPSQGGLTSLGNNQWRMPNGITLYASDAMAKDALYSLLPEYTDVFQPKEGTAKVPPGQEMEVPLLPGWAEKQTKGTTKVYPLSRHDQAVVDDLFDSLHD